MKEDHNGTDNMTVNNEMIKGILHPLSTVVKYELETDDWWITLFKEDEIDEGQPGYSVDTEGNSLIGEEPGDWQASWLVIGKEDHCGDPVFIDCKEEGYPVYTACHGEGDWEPQLLRDTLEEFLTNFR